MEDRPLAGVVGEAACEPDFESLSYAVATIRGPRAPLSCSQDPYAVRATCVLGAPLTFSASNSTGGPPAECRSFDEDLIEEASHRGNNQRYPSSLCLNLEYPKPREMEM